MANALYGKGKEALLSALVNFPSDVVKMAMVNTSYTPNLASHQFYSDLAANVVGTPQTLTGKSIVGGVVTCADVTFTAVAGGSTAKYVVVYKDTGTAGSSPLLAIWDSISGFPLVTNGGDVTIQIDTGANRLFKI